MNLLILSYLQNSRQVKSKLLFFVILIKRFPNALQDEPDLQDPNESGIGTQESTIIQDNDLNHSDEPTNKDGDESAEEVRPADDEVTNNLMRAFAEGDDNIDDISIIDEDEMEERENERKMGVAAMPGKGKFGTSTMRKGL